MRSGERGAALLLALVALVLLLPLALILSEYVAQRQRQGVVLRDSVGGQLAVRGALDLVMARLRAGDLAVAPGDRAAIDAGAHGPRPVRVQVSRHADVVVTRSGDVVAPDGLDLKRVGVDAGGRAIRDLRLLEVYVVEAERPAYFPVPAVRLLAVVGRLDDGQVVCLGMRYDRGYFQ